MYITMLLVLFLGLRMAYLWGKNDGRWQGRQEGKDIYDQN